MKKKAVICFILTAAIMLISACAAAEPQPRKTHNVQDPKGTIRVYAWPGQIEPVIDKFLELHPDFRYNITAPFIQDIGYTPLDSELTQGDRCDVDIYFVGSTPGTNDFTNFTQGEMAKYALPYEALGIDVDAGIQKAGILQYIVETGTLSPYDNAEGKTVVGLSIDSRACAFIYRRSLAKEVWGTDDPAVVKTKIGPGWEKYLEAETELWNKGYTIGFLCDLLTAVRSCGKGYIAEQVKDKQRLHNNVQDKICIGYMGPARELGDIVYRSSDKNDIEVYGTSGDWAVCEPPENFFSGGAWVLASRSLAKDTDKKAAVAELIEWMTLDCTENGLQYIMANGMLDYGNGPSGMKTTVASRAVMEMCDGTMEFLGGQDIFDVFIPASENINGAYYSEYWRRYP